MAWRILLNLTMAVVWVILNNSWTVVTFVIGYLIGFAVLFLFRRFFPEGVYGRRLAVLAVLIGIFIKELFKSNIEVIKQVAKPKLTITPGIVALPIEVRTPWEITLLANMITLTPGTLTIDVSEDQSVLFIHVMDLDEAEEIIRDIKETFERRILEVSR